jgi:amino acid transporter
MTTKDSPVSKISALPGEKLEPDAIGLGQDTAIGTASGAPGVSVALSMAGLTLAAAHADLPVIVLTAVPMLIIANAYRQLNLWNANCGASFEWVGRAVSPYLGWLTGWIMLAAYITGCVSGVLVLGPSVTAVLPALSGSNAQDLAIALAVIAVMTIVAVAGIRLSARVQVAMAVAEYAILAGFAVWGFIAELRHAPGTAPVSAGWFSLHGITGHGSLVPGILIAIYMFSGWEGTLYVNEEVRHRRENPGRAAILAVLILTVLYSMVLTGLEGILPAGRLQRYPTTAQPRQDRAGQYHPGTGQHQAGGQGQPYRQHGRGLAHADWGQQPGQHPLSPLCLILDRAVWDRPGRVVPGLVGERGRGHVRPGGRVLAQDHQDLPAKRQRCRRAAEHRARPVRAEARRDIEPGPVDR